LTIQNEGDEGEGEEEKKSSWLSSGRDVKVRVGLQTQVGGDPNVIRQSAWCFLPRCRRL